MWKRITEGAITLAILTIMVLMFAYVPLIGSLIGFFVPIPFIYYTAKYNWKSGLLFFIGALVLTAITCGILFLPLVILLGATGIVFGSFIHMEKDRFSTYITATLTFLIIFTMLFVVMSSILEINFIEEIKTTVDEALNRFVDLLELTGQQVDSTTLKMFEETFETFLVLMPTVLVLMSAFLVLVIQLVSLPILKRLGIKVKEAKPFRELSLPKQFIWYFLLILIASFFVTAEHKGTFFYNAVINLVYITQALFIFQGFTFIFITVIRKKYQKLSRLPYLFLHS